MSVPLLLLPLPPLVVVLEPDDPLYRDVLFPAGAFGSAFSGGPSNACMQVAVSELQCHTRNSCGLAAQEVLWGVNHSLVGQVHRTITSGSDTSCTPAASYELFGSTCTVAWEPNGSPPGADAARCTVSREVSAM
jgi:hypothetical protein